MQQSIEFVSNHLLLFAMLALVVGLLIHNLFVTGKGSLEPQAATELINRQDAVIVDVRPTADFSAGHIIDAVNVPINGFKNQIGALEKYKERPVILTCRSGSQSSNACQQLRKQGFAQVYNLRGGILAWQSANLPLTRKRK